MYLRTLTDEELLNYAEQTVHELTTSDLERELMRRLGERLEPLGEDARIEVLNDRGLATVEDLEAHFENVSKAREALEGLA